MRIPASAADAAAVNPKDINTLLANGLITFFIKGNPVFNKGQVIYLKNHQTEFFINLCFRKFYISGRIIIESISYFCFLFCCK